MMRRDRRHRLTPLQREIIDRMKAGERLWCYVGSLAAWDDFFIGEREKARHIWQGSRTRDLLVQRALIRDKTRHRVTGMPFYYQLTKAGQAA